MPIVITIDTASDIPSVKKKDVVARFTRDGCPHCKTSQSDWDKVCKILDKEYEDKEKIAVMEIEAGLENALGFQFPDGRPYSVPGYPTVAHFSQGVFQGEHEGGRSAPELITHIMGVLDLKKKPKKQTKRKKDKKRCSSCHRHSRGTMRRHSGAHRHRRSRRSHSPHKHRSPHRHRSPHKHRRRRRSSRRNPVEVVDLSQLVGGSKKKRRRSR